MMTMCMMFIDNLKVGAEHDVIISSVYGTSVRAGWRRVKFLSSIIRPASIQGFA
jgi:hypothetical protein